MTDRTIEGFTAQTVSTPAGAVFAQCGGSGPPILLLHGFPETSMMWHSVAPILTRHYRVVAMDLPGYGRSGCPAETTDHSAMSKRSIARTLVEAMRQLGHESFAVVGHDRGGRVAYRMALDHPDTITAVAVLDVVPTAEVWDRADARLALSFWPFSLLAQPAPLPERLIAADPQAVIDNALSQWGSPSSAFPDWLRDYYVAALSDPEHIHAICEEYRAAASIDREHDLQDRKAGRRIACELLCLWSAAGAVGSWYGAAGGPIELWKNYARSVSGWAMKGGHFFPEERPQETAELLDRFLGAAIDVWRSRLSLSLPERLPPATTP